MMATFDAALDRIVGIKGPEALSDYRKQRAEQDAHRAKLIEEIRRRGLDAMDHVVEIVRAPLISRWDIEQAIKELQKALPAATELDPPEAA